MGFTDPPTLTRTSAAGTNPMDWSAVYPNIDPDNDYIAMRFRVNGGAWTQEADVLFTTAMYVDFIETGSFSFAWPIFDGTTFAAGALVEVQEAIKRGATYYWSTSISDTMAAVVGYTHGGELTSATSATSQTFNNVAFAAGVPVVTASNFANIGGTTDASPTSITLTPSGGGTTINLVERIDQSQSTSVGRTLTLWSGSAAIGAGNYNIVVTRGAAARSNAFTYGVLTNANPTPTVVSGDNTSSGTSLQATPAATLPANGLALAALWYNTASAVSVNAPSIERAEVVGGDARGICLASRNSTGAVEFVNASGALAKFIIAWGPA